MIAGLLVANRGEIAVRVVRACRDLGIRSVAVYTESEVDDPHVRLADEAIRLSGKGAAAYLDVPDLLRVARRARVDAVHPGYGFLSESPVFAESVRAAGLIWVGPPPEAIRLLGDKVAARQVAARVRAPMVAATQRALADAEEAVAFAETHGFPLVMKAAHGGGGRGMRIVRTWEELVPAYEAAVREATASFGNGECFLERYLERARHVETQCLADQDGSVAVLSTRDCSVQRRHQKLIEEAPAPFLTGAQHDTLVSASTAILREAGYVGAGTCEFLLGADGTLSFLEVNTRLQVEHPVTEEVTGVDLVAEQLRIADGGRLREYPSSRGHSIEFRINAEDAAAGFRPAPGTVSRWQEPGGPGVRVDAGVGEGTTVTGEFDSMLAKLVITGPDRLTAVRRARRALGEFRIEGLPTLVPLHLRVLDHPDFAVPDERAAFAVHTDWVAPVVAAGMQPQTPVAPGAAPAVRRRQVLEVNGRRVTVITEDEPEPERTGAARRRPLLGRKGHRSGSAGGGATLASPMPGVVVRMLVEAGQTVEAGEPVLVLEAMKMQQTVPAHRSGRVQDLQVEAGAAVGVGQILCRIGE